MPQDLFPPPQNARSLIVRGGYGIGAILLGSAATLALALLTGPETPARAEAAQVQTPAAIAPSSFADVVEKVRGAVVSVKVKTTETADASEEFEFPQIVPGDPLERFFKHF